MANKNFRLYEARIFSAISFLFLCGIFAVLASTANEGRFQQDAPNWLIATMYLYLIFIFFRTVFHLLFSFAWLLFRRDLKNPPNHFPLISIIVPCYQEELVIDTAIKSILELNYPNFEVIIVDDGSTDLTFEKARNLIENKRLRAIFQKNSGKASALNRGISEARGEYVFCMDADSKLSPDVLLQGIKHFSNNSNLAAVAGSVRIGNAENVICAFQKLEYITALNFLKLAQSFLQIVTVVPGPVGLFKKEKIQNIGGYKTETFAEDCDLTLRLLMAGYAVIYEPKMYAITEAPEEFNSLIKQRYRWSRGIVQAIKLNSKWLLSPLSNLRNFFIMWYMLVESIVIPTVNYLFVMVAIFMALKSESHIIIGYYFSQLVLLDLVIITYSLITENFSFRLLLLGFVNRFTYGLALEIQRFFAIFDELFELPMTWGKLERKGLK